MQFQTLELSELQPEVALRCVCGEDEIHGDSLPAPGVSQVLSPQPLSLYKVAVFT